jgi:molybdate transport system ATP-binding protein
VLTVRDKGKLPDGQTVTWVIPSDGVSLQPEDALTADDFVATVTEARHLGEITLATLAVAAVPGACLTLTLAGAQRQTLVAGSRRAVRLNRERVHVMPVRTP